MTRAAQWYTRREEFKQMKDRIEYQLLKDSTKVKLFYRFLKIWYFFIFFTHKPLFLVLFLLIILVKTRLNIIWSFLKYGKRRQSPQTPTCHVAFLKVVFPIFPLYTEFWQGFQRFSLLFAWFFVKNSCFPAKNDNFVCFSCTFQQKFEYCLFTIFNKKIWRTNAQGLGLSSEIVCAPLDIGGKFKF